MSSYDAELAAEEAMGIVRRYSDKVEAEGTTDAITVAFVKQEKKDKAASDAANARYRNWNAFLLSSPETNQGDITPEQENLDEASRKLLVAWQRFASKLNKKLPAGQQIDLSQPPNFMTLQEAVEDAQWSWKKHRDGTRTGRFHGALANLTQTFDDYKDLLAFIPTNDKYVCLLTGSLSALAKATVNHQNIADGISEALEGVKNDIQFWRRQIAIHGNNGWMRSYIIRLYVIVFEMYTDIFVEWSSSKLDRFLGSFDRSFFDKKVASKRAEMKELERNLEREAKLSTEARIQELPTRNDIEEILQQFSELLQAQLGKSGQSLLRQIAHTQLLQVAQPGNSQHVLDVGATPSSTGNSTSDNVLPDVHLPDPTQQLKSVMMGLKIDRQEITTAHWLSQASHLTIDTDTYGTLQRWVHGSEKHCIWIEGPYETPSPSEASLISAALINVSRQSKAQCISYFCTEAAVEQNNNDFHATALMKMVYSLIGQLIAYLPDKPEEITNLSKSHLQGLDGSTASVPQAVEVLRILMTIGPRVLICLVDGVQVLEDRGNASQMAHLHDVVDLLAPKDTAVDNVVRTCFTTDGNSDVLAELVGNDRAARVDYDTEFRDIVGAEGAEMSTL